MVRGRWREWVRRFSLEEDGALRKTGKEKKTETGEGTSEGRRAGGFSVTSVGNYLLQSSINKALEPFPMY